MAQLFRYPLCYHANCPVRYNKLSFLSFFSSRAHTIVGVTFTQKRKNDAGEETAKTSLINLVDLAGR